MTGLLLATASPALAGPAPTATPPAAAAGPLYAVPFSADLYSVDNGTLRAITYEEWRDSYAFQRPVSSTNVVQKYSWSPTIYASSSFPGTDEVLTDDLTYEQWRIIGFPAPKTSSLISGTEVFKWGSSSELFLQTPSQEFHKLTFAEWDATGRATFTNRSPNGFLKLTWNANIVFSSDITSPGSNLPVPGDPLTYAEWAAFGAPTALEVQRFPNDRFTKNCDSPVINYMGPTYYFSLTYAEWRAAGSPQPDIIYCNS